METGRETSLDAGTYEVLPPPSSIVSSPCFATC